MHETSLIEFTLNAVEDRCMQLGLRRVKCIHLVVGELRGALPELMQEAFSILTYKRPAFHGAVLDIETRPVQLRCEACGAHFTPADFHAVACPVCGGGRYAVAQGNELLIDSFEGE